MLNTLGFFLLLNSSSWMYDYRDIIYPKTLHEITIPGTHDSASYNLSRNKYIDIPEIYIDIIKFGEFLKLPISDIIQNWTKTQNIDIYGQLEMGSRYIDLRLCFYKNAWYSHHNFVVGTLLSELLDQIYNFLIKNQGELLILDITHVYNSSSDNIKLLNRTIYERLNVFMYKDTTYKNETIGKLIGQGGRILVVSSIDIFMYEGLLLNEWANTDNTTKMISFSDKFMKSWNNNSYKQLVKLDWVLTPSLQTVILNLANNYSLSILEKDLYKELYLWTQKYVDRPLVRCPVLPNIISIDFIDKGNLAVHTLISLFKCNFKN